MIALVLQPLTLAEAVSIDRPTARCLLRLEASRLSASADPAELALSRAMQLGADALTPERPEQ